MRGQALRPVISGTAQVVCVHDREKRKVLTEQHVSELGLEMGIVYDSRLHRIHRCGCCENLFVDPSDEPLYCETCRQPLVHALGGPLASPIGPVDG